MGMLSVKHTEARAPTRAARQARLTGGHIQTETLPALAPSDLEAYRAALPAEWAAATPVVEGVGARARIHFIVGRPGDAALEPAYRDALAILGKSPGADVVEEAEADAVLTRFADEIEDYEAAAAGVGPAGMS